MWDKLINVKIDSFLPLIEYSKYGRRISINDYVTTENGN